MAKKIYDEEITKQQDWGGDESTGNLPVAGGRVQEFIKNTFDKKIGTLYYDTTNNRYLAFADTDTRDEYLEDTTKTELVLGTFDAPFNYNASIKLISKQLVNIFKGTTGNYIEFTFDTTNKSGSSVGEGVICTYTFIRGATKQVVTAKYGYGETVRFLIDDYLKDGTNTITIGIQGQTTLAATTVAVVYKVINLSIEDEFDIAKANIGVNQIEIPYTVSGQGTKVVNWYLDGVKQDFVKDEDEITEATSSRTKYLDITGYNKGVHTYQAQVVSTIDGEEYKSDILYREFIVADNTTSDDIYFVSKYVIPSANGIKEVSTDNILYDIQQYIDYSLNFAVYNCKKPASTAVEIYIDNELQTTINAANEELQTYTFTQYVPQTITIKFKAGNTEYNLSGKVNGSSLNISEITNGLVLAFTGTGRSNSSADKNEWSYNDYVGELTGFNFTNISGWVDNSLYINNGASFGINYAPLGNNPEVLGRTIELSFKTLNVSNDDAVICDLTNGGIGLKVTASEAILISREGFKVSTKFKSEEDVRISFVINRRTGSTNKGLAFIYINGILSGATKYATSDSFESSSNFLMKGIEDAEIKLYQIRVYNTALSHDQILNNFILYQKTAKELQEVYYRNDVLEDGSSNLSMDKLERFLPVMLITGNIPILENTNNKKEQITVDIDYYNLQDPTKSFSMKKAAMTPQGTSSMSYPKKNFRIYTKKIDDTVVYDYQGKVIEDKLYAFKEGSQPVKTYCLKADYAESSSTHNTGIARLWNAAMYNAQIDGEYKLRTEAQKQALKNDYMYDVRTAVDGFPILMFYRLDETSDIIFIGKYNFNNDKSTESVFGFKDIPGFDNTKMQCWEVLNNGNHLALFQDTNNWDNEWTDAFEARYPDVGDEADTTDLKAFAEWLVSCKDDADKFKTEKWNHLDIYKVAAYYIYLMRFGAVDQTVKNSMFTSEDGTHFYFINYDNDTVLGVRNDGLLIYPPTITRQSLDTTYTTEVYAYAGHDSTLWNLLEADSEFMQIVSTVDNALYQAGLRYADVIDMFDTKQSKKWCERIYNQDSQYKYIGPYVNDGIDNLYMLQGSREAHRKWWLSRRFNLLDSEYVSGAYKSNVLECKMASAPSGIQFSIEAGYDMKYGYGVNNVAVDTGMSLTKGQHAIFTTKQVLNLGDPMRIYSANNLQGVDLSGFTKYLSTVNVSSVYDSILGTKLKNIILGNGIDENTSLSEIQGLVSAKRLENINIEGYKAITNLNLSEAYYLKEVHAHNSGLRSIDLANGNQNLTTLELPNTLQSLILKDLPNLKSVDINTGTALINISITGCKNIVSYDDVQDYIYNNLGSLESIAIDNIDWKCTANELLQLVENFTFKYDFRGKVTLDSVNQEQVDRLTAVFGESAFDKNSSFYIVAPDSIFVSGPDIIYEGDTGKFTSVIFSQESGTGTTIYKIQSGSRTGTTLNSSTGELTTTENGNSDATLTILAQYISPSGKVNSASKQVTIKKRIYPTNTELSSAIKGPSELLKVGETYTYTLELDITKYTGRFTDEIQWELSGDLANYASITYKLNNICKITFNSDVPGSSNGGLSIILTKQIGGIIKGGIELSAKNENVAITISGNPFAMQAFYKAGLAANETFMTKQECALVTDSDLEDSDGFFVTNKPATPYATFTRFDEFKYFTSITKVPPRFFNQCTSLNTITLPEQITEIGNSAFSYSSIISIVIPNNVTIIKDGAFNNCSKLKNITLSNKLKTIEGYSFAYCNNLDISDIVFPDTLTTVQVNQTFQSCKCTKAFHFPKNVGDNYVNAFNDAYITEIYFNDIITTKLTNLKYKIIHLGKSHKACTSSDSASYLQNTTNIYVGDNPNYSGNSDGTVITCGNTLVFYNQKSGSIPSNVTDMCNYCIYNRSFTNFIVPDTFTGDIYNLWLHDCGTVTLNGGKYNYTFKLDTIDNLNIGVSLPSNTGYKFSPTLKNINNLYIDTTAKYLFCRYDTGGESFQYNLLECSINKIEINPNHSSIFDNGNGFIYNVVDGDSDKRIPILAYQQDSIYIGGSLDFDINFTFNFGCDNYLIDSITIENYDNALKLVGTISNNITSITIKDTVNLTSITADLNTLNSLKIPNGSVLILTKNTYLGIVDIGTSTTNISNWKGRYLTYVYNFYCRATTAPTVSSGCFYYSSNAYMGRNTNQPKILYVPANSTGYDEGLWKSELIDKCGFTLSKTL